MNDVEKKNLMCTHTYIHTYICPHLDFFLLSLSFHSFIHKQEINCLSPLNKQQRSSNNVDDRRRRKKTALHTYKNEEREGEKEKKEEEEERMMC